jgi:Electron transfer DM13
MRNRGVLLISAVVVVVVGVVGYLAFGVFGIQAAFTSTAVSEPAPTFGADGGSTTTGNGLGPSELDAAMQDAAQHPTQVDEVMMPGPVRTVLQGSFSGRSGHSVRGNALVLSDGTKQRFLRLDEFQSTNGPALKVYLRADDGAYVSLGDLKGNIGNQNYEIGPDVDLARFHTVQIWCERFSVLFGDAGLA